MRSGLLSQLMFIWFQGPCSPCTQPCPAPRSACGHHCAAPCHPDQPCPATACRTEITVRCECGRREERVLCMQGASNESRDAECGRMAAISVAARLWEGQSIDIAVLKKELKNRKYAMSATCSSLYNYDQGCSLPSECRLRVLIQN
jgi:transcriptional repressor NF-X1